MKLEPSRTIKIFYCYAHEDKALRERLSEHLAPLRRNGRILDWCDQQIEPGGIWEREIEQQMNAADIILLLISSAFIDSDYCYTKEMQHAFERHKAGEVRIIPIILRSVYWKELPFAQFQVLPTDANPLDLWLNLDEALENVVQGISNVVDTLAARKLHRDEPPVDAPEQGNVTLDLTAPAARNSVPPPGASMAVTPLSMPVSGRIRHLLPAVRVRIQVFLVLVLVVGGSLGTWIVASRTAAATTLANSNATATALTAPITLANSNATAITLANRNATATALANSNATATTLTPANPGQVWHVRNDGVSMPFVGLEGITWSGTQFVVVGDDGMVLTSPDGRAWTEQHSGTSEILLGIAWSGTQFVAVGTGGTILTSPNGRTWTEQHSGILSVQGLGPPEYFKGIAWSGTQFVVVGTGGTILTSPNGHAWTEQHSGTSQTIVGIIWADKQFVAVDMSGTIRTSTNGRTWTAQNTGTIASLSDVVWSGKQFVAVGAGGAILTSANGRTWTKQGFHSTEYFEGIAWSGTEFVVVDDDESIFTSANGSTWTEQNSGVPQGFDGIVWSGKQFVAVSDGGVILTSS